MAVENSENKKRKEIFRKKKFSLLDKSRRQNWNRCFETVFPLLFVFFFCEVSQNISMIKLLNCLKLGERENRLKKNPVSETN